MVEITLSWAAFKAKELPISYADLNDNYYLYCSSETTDYVCVIPNTGVDATDFDNNYKDSATSL